MKFASFILLASLLAVNAYAEGQPLESLDLVKLIEKASAHSEADSVWAVRVTNFQVIGKHRAALEAFKWCSQQNENSDACILAGGLARETEPAIPDAIAMNLKIIQHLESSPRNKQSEEHLKVLREQVAVLKQMPTPFHDMVQDAVRDKVK